MYKALILDMDGLIIDSELIAYRCYKSLLNKYGFPFTKEDYIKDYPGKALIKSLRFIKRKYKLNFDLKEEFEYIRQIENKIITEEGVDLKAGIFELLTYARANNYKLGIATSSIPERVHLILDKSDILAYFDAITYGNEVKHGKPAPDIFLKACQKLAVDPQEALVLEDSEAGIKAAYDGGIHVICIPDLKYPGLDYQDMTVDILDNLAEAVTYLKEH